MIYHFDQTILVVSVVGKRNDSAAYQDFDRKNELAVALGSVSSCGEMGRKTEHGKEGGDEETT